MLLGMNIVYSLIEYSIRCSRYGHPRVVELLLRSKRFSVNAVDNSHMSPLHLAVINGRVEVIRILLDFPDINVVRLSTTIVIHREIYSFF